MTEPEFLKQWHDNFPKHSAKTKQIEEEVLPAGQESDPLKPLLTLLVKLGSIVVHTDEFLSLNGHPFDRQALVPLLRDPEVEKWIAAMYKLCFLPQKRDPKSKAV